LAGEARDASLSACDRTMWRVCSANGWWSAFGKKRGKNGKRPGPPVHDDLVKRDFTADRPSHLWLGDIERHEALSNRVGVRDLHRRVVAAAW
jgi:putative transposase